ncbi:methyltransferase domain-containing protein [Nitrospinae bacterium AH_259_B05_G02_I21]|nr:methyltransferase domain-containing protein [Nitrospinae bacterium AH_259_B05_G02_I21]
MRKTQGLAMEQKRWKTGSVEGFESYWRTIEPRLRKRYSEGETLGYHEYITYLGNTLVEEYIQQDGPGLSVELGCGRADTSLFLAKRGWQPALLDISQTALELAKSNFSEEKASCVLTRADLLSAPFREHSFHLVMSFGVLEHFEDPVRPLREMVRILKPGGTLCNSVVYTNRVNFQTVVDWLYHIPGTIVKHGALRRDPAKARQMVALWRGQTFFENNLCMEEYVTAMKRLGLIEIQVIPCATIPALSLTRPLEVCYIQGLKAFCAIKRRVTGRHPLKALFGGRRAWYLFGQKPAVG